MTEARDWEYWQWDSLVGDPIFYFLFSHGVTFRLDQTTRTWIKTRFAGQLARYIAFGEVGASSTTREAVEDALGFTLPDPPDLPD